METPVISLSANRRNHLIFLELTHSDVCYPMSPAPPGLGSLPKRLHIRHPSGHETYQPDTLLEFLKVVECEKLYLVRNVVVDYVAIDALSRLKDNYLLCVKPL